MPDLFDNFFSKISSTFNGGKTTAHYGGSSQVNAGRFYNAHNNVSNNKYWMTKQETIDLNKIQIVSGLDEEEHISPRKHNSISGIANYVSDKPSDKFNRERFSSVSSEESNN